jgi:transcriptional accessory protein Tex/SPT6
VRNLDGYLGQQIEVRVIKLNKKRGNVVVSRKEILEEEQNAKRSATMEHLEEGASSPARSRTSPTTARSSTSAASTACCTSPT